MARTSLKNIARLIQTVQETVPPEQSFLDDLKRSIELQNNKESRLPSKTYKPSSMQCIRNMYFQIMGCEQDEGETSYGLIGICNSGTDIHERTQKSVLDMISNGMDCEYINVADYVREHNLTDLEIVNEPDFENGVYETKLFHTKLNMSFLCDGIIRYKGVLYILEIKTESGYKFVSRKEVDPKHYNQGIAYSIAFGLSNVIFLYISRDVLDMKSYMFNVTDVMRQNLLSKIHECNQYVESGTIPEKPEDVPKNVCAYCPYKTLCN